MTKTFKGTTYDIFLKDTRRKNGEITSRTFIDKSKEGAKKQAKQTFKPFMKIIKIKAISKIYR